ncbi:MAG TPA: ABC transporter permease subunit, partial [Dongiaceae bacterium]|nr:ABC transporter permease subunit [Dongiaceae bacterium]
KKRTYIGFGVFIVSQFGMLLLFRNTDWRIHAGELLTANGYSAPAYLSALTVALVLLVPELGLLLPLYVTLIGGDLVAKEAEEGTLRLVLARPISRVRLLLVKWLAGAAYTVVLVLVLGAVSLAFARLFFPWGGMFVAFQPPPELELPSVQPVFSLFSAHHGLMLYLISHGLIAFNTVTFMSLAFMFSCFNMKPTAATILALSFGFASSVLQNIPFFARYQSWFITYHLQSWFWVYQQPTPWWQIVQSEVILLATTATAIVVGAWGFQVRDLKS